MHTRHLLAATLVAATLVGARADAQPARFGVYLGSSIATISEGDDFFAGGENFGLDKKRRIGLQAGLWLNAPLTGSLSLQPELHFTQKGVSFGANFEDFGDGPSDASISLDLSYLELPVLLRADFGQGDGRVRPFVLAGPVLAYQTSCSFGIDAGGFDASEECDADLEADEQINKLDVGAAVGGGLAFKLAGPDATAGLRYTHGLRSLSKEGESVTNRNVSVLFGIGF